MEYTRLKKIIMCESYGAVVRQLDGGLNLRGVSKKFGEWYQKTNKTEDTN
jgi:hypothetical protein